MRITESIEQAAPTEDVFAMICSHSFQELKCERSGALEHEATIEVEDDATTIVTRRRLPTDDFPDFVRSVVGSTVDVVETQRWGGADSDGSRGAGVEVHIPGTPVEFTGSMWLVPAEGAPDRSRHDLDGELQAHVPMLGGRIEKSVAPVLAKAFRLEATVAQEWREQQG